MGRKRPHGGRGRKGSSGPRKQRMVFTGTIHVSRPGVAEVSTPEGTFPVARGGIREAMSGDEVQVTVSHRGSERFAHVQSVMQRATTTFLGSFAWAEPLGVVVPLDSRIRRDFFVIPGDDSARRLGVTDGSVVVARILEYPTRSSAGVVTVERLVGSQEGLDMNIECVLASFDLPQEFSPAAQEQAAAIEPRVAQALAADPAREDLRSHVALTVDPADARDFDDAVEAKRLEGGGYEVWVHIADVSHYVGWNTPIDNEAKRRTCSTYLVDRVIPMLPEALCNDVCSLRPDEDRLCMSVRMRLDRRGNVVGARAMKSAIRSRCRLDYGTVDLLLSHKVDEKDLPCGPALAPVVAESLRVLDEVARLRIDVRARRGAIDFETREAKVTLDEDGRPTGVTVRTKTAATSLIEEAMLLANECVAKMLADADAETAYRVHERPSPEDLGATLPVLHELGLVHGFEAAAVMEGDPHAIAQVIARAEGTTGEFLANSVLLRAQKRAIYLPHNDGHYALGAKAYCHFTSPIRRYPDVLVHRALKWLLAGEKDSRTQREVLVALPQLCRTSSDRERVSDSAARATQKVKMSELYAEHVGESFSGIVVGVERYGLFVMIEDTCAEGLLPIRALGDEWFEYDEKRMSLAGAETGRMWRPGQRIAVTVTGATPAKGQIDFALAAGRAAGAVDAGGRG